MHSAKGGRKPVASVLTQSYTIDEAANQAADTCTYTHTALSSAGVTGGPCSGETIQLLNNATSSLQILAQLT